MKPDAIAWFQNRGISQATLELAGVESGTVYFGDLNRKSDAVFFRYREGWKARAYPEKAFVAGGGYKPTFWGLDEALQANNNLVLIVEGECDRLALIEAGIPPCQILSAPSASTGLEYAHSALQEGLQRVSRFVWCGDADEAGIKLRGEFLRLIGAARFYYVEWPEGIKDANDMLVKEGPEALRDLVLNGALPWPQEGLFRLSELPTPPPLTIWTPSIGGFEGRVNLAPRTLSVVTGAPGMGKSLMWGQLWWEIAHKYNIVCCIASFETRPKPHMRRQFRTLLTGKLEYELTQQECDQADAWIENHYLFLTHSEQRPTLEWFLDCAETAVVRHGAKVIQLDPWNRLEAMRAPRESETDYILRCLRALYVFAQDFDVHLQIVAHPAKMDGPRRGQPPTLEDISGSRHWDNIVDQGFVIHRPQMFDGTERKTEADFYHRKARFDELGHPCRIRLNYDLGQRKYVPLSAGLTAEDFD